MFRWGLYKRSQGRITRQITFAALAIGVAIGMYRLGENLPGVGFSFRFGLSEAAFAHALHFGVPGVLLLIGWWISYRVVNLPSFADFLIAVEAEMNKVSWPARGELLRASAVVLVVIISMAILLLLLDLFWQRILHLLGI
jgi:preprotein translocase subunit SecE